MKNICKK